MSGKSPEEVALLLTQIIGEIEGRELTPRGKNPADRRWLLDTYATCLNADKGHRLAKLRRPEDGDEE